MKNLNPEVLTSDYGSLVVSLVHTMLATGELKNIAGSPASVIGCAVAYADEIVAQLHEREIKAKAFAESSRVILPVDWSCGPEDDANRSGQHWSQPEIDALIAQFKNGKTGSEIAVHHRRTWTAVSAQLAKYGLLYQESRGRYERIGGDPWEL